MSSIKPAIVLFFVNGPAPTPKDMLEAASMNATVRFRNALAVAPDENGLETCDGVAGCVPPVYAERFPTAEDAIAKKAAELKALAAKVGDTPAPKKADKAVAKAHGKVEAQPDKPAAIAGWQANQ